MRILSYTLIALVLLIGAWTIGTTARAYDGDDKGNDGGDHNIAILDNCLPTDPGWTPSGGCTLKAKDGDVSFSEFGALLFTPLSPPGSLIGHPSWRMQPTYISTGDETIQVRNGGGRTHTFTEVANYGGGFVPPLNGDLSPAPECLTSPPTIAPGDRQKLNNLTPGLHKYQCCIHPWMRAAIRIDSH